MELITFNNFRKKKNSTLRPTVDNGQSHNVALKEPCSIKSPVFRLNKFDVLSNYAYVPSWGRYYWITEITYINANVIEISCISDSLATARDTIGASEQFILRSSANYNLSIADGMGATMQGRYQKLNAVNFIDTESIGTFVVGIIGKGNEISAPLSGSVTYYMVSSEQMQDLMNFMFTEDNFTDVISDEVVKSFFNPSQYVSNVYYLPFGQLSGGSTIKLGWFDTGVTGTRLGAGFLDMEDLTIQVPRAVDGNYSHYLNYEPFSSYTLYIPYIGDIEISGQMLREDASLKIIRRIDVATGKLHISIKGNESGKIIGFYDGQIGATLPLAQTRMTMNEFSAIGGIASVVGDAIQGLDGDLEKFGGAIGAAGNALAGTQKQVSVTGSAGDISQRFFELRCLMRCNYNSQTAIDYDRIGGPLFLPCKISDIAGFIMCRDARITSYTLMDSEREEIENLMNGGFYYE